MMSAFCVFRRLNGPFIFRPQRCLAVAFICSYIPTRVAVLASLLIGPLLSFPQPSFDGLIRRFSPLPRGWFVLIFIFLPPDVRTYQPLTFILILNPNLTLTYRSISITLTLA